MINQNVLDLIKIPLITYESEEYILRYIPFYAYNQITDELICEHLDDVECIGKQGAYYMNCPCSFDIEVSSFYENDIHEPENKRSCMYTWQMDLNGLCFYGRTWDEFVDICLRLQKLYELDKNFILVIYIQNLAYEFQFIRKLFTWKKVFARSKRKPIEALTDIGIMFKCSYFLSGFSLQTIAKNLHSHKINKLGDFDYTKIRTPLTPLTKPELKYMLHDVLIIEYFISEEIERNGDITKIPLTNTGYVRRYIKEKCYDKTKKDNNEYKKFHALMKNLKISEAEYLMLKRVYSGGFTHANACYARKTLHDIFSIDFNSCYPSVMINEMFPMSTGAPIDVGTIKSKEEFQQYLDNFCCIIDVEIKDLESTTFIEHPISLSKCFDIEDYVVDNGRIVSAKRLITTFTEVDYSYINQFYEWSSFEVINMIVYEKGYLPKPFVNAILDLYEDKTKLKDLDDFLIEYVRSKGMLNSAYGMLVTDIAPDEITYIQTEDIEEWQETKVDLESCLEVYNNKKQKFLFYPWGVYVTSYARRNLFAGIIEFAGDYVYSDTDSIKGKNFDNHKEFIDWYNEKCIIKNELAMKHHSIDIERTQPIDSKGKKRILGVWDYEGTYTTFKTLGAKRYMTLRNNKKGKPEYQITVSGVKKSDGIKYILSESKRTKTDPFNLFDMDFIIPAGHTGKMTMTYLDDEMQGIVTDYLGVKYSYDEPSGIHGETTSYNFSFAQEYFDYLEGIKHIEWAN